MGRNVFENSNLAEHKTSDDHDSRYYTETEINNILGRISQSGVCDLADPPSAYIFMAAPGSTNLPSGLGGNSCLVLQMFPGNSMYNALLAFNFASDKIAIKRRSGGSGAWTGWKYVTFS